MECHVSLRICDCGYEWPPAEVFIANELPEMESVVFTKSPPTTIKILEWGIEEHQSKKNQKFLGKVIYKYHETDYKVGQVYLWLCFSDYYEGFAVQKAQEKWSMISNGPFPTSVDEFIESDFLNPVSILVDFNGKYPNLISVECEPAEIVVPVPEGSFEYVPPKAEEEYLDDIPF
jgi:hypothetical protein